MNGNDELWPNVRPMPRLEQPSMTASRNGTMFGRTMPSSGRSIEDIPLPPGAIGYPEVLHEALLDDEALEGIIRAGNKPEE